jgi:hypothetical protein
MATTLDDEFKMALRDHAHGANGANERYVLSTVRIVSANIDGDEEIWNLSAAEAEKRAAKFRLMAAYSLRGAAICDDRAKEAREQETQAFAQLHAST